MTTRISITVHEPGSHGALLAEVFRVAPYGQVCDTPVTRRKIAPGVATAMHLRPGSVLVVREAPAAEDGEEA